NARQMIVIARLIGAERAHARQIRMVLVGEERDEIGEIGFGGGDERLHVLQPADFSRARIAGEADIDELVRFARADLLKAARRHDGGFQRKLRRERLHLLVARRLASLVVDARAAAAAQNVHAVGTAAQSKAAGKFALARDLQIDVLDAAAPLAFLAGEPVRGADEARLPDGEGGFWNTRVAE